MLNDGAHTRPTALPFLFRPEELQPGHVVSVVTATLDQFGL